ncbi:hypothetical protein AB833_03475 [Chromatiales bacterium (ex Bugula neritina AB1)]|nr:hypothetical protein AB833_03475 [Chromatiales bacterium (ex Bugula neritina AB1)]
MSKLTNLFVCCLFVLLWSSGWIAAKFGIGLMGPFTFLAWVYFSCLAILPGCSGSGVIRLFSKEMGTYFPR